MFARIFLIFSTILQTSSFVRLLRLFAVDLNAAPTNILYYTRFHIPRYILKQRLQPHVIIITVIYHIVQTK